MFRSSLISYLIAQGLGACFRSNACTSYGCQSSRYGATQRADQASYSRDYCGYTLIHDCSSNVRNSLMPRSAESQRACKRRQLATGAMPVAGSG
jgi:hypothetical protein